jgi:DNA-binding protein HU-beta
MRAACATLHPATALIRAVINNAQEGERMNKSELIEAIAKKVPNATKTACAGMVDAFTDTVTSSLKKGDSVTLVGFGTFSVGKRAARTGRNPRTGEALKIPAAKVPKFSAGASLKTAVNRK